MGVINCMGVVIKGYIKNIIWSLVVFFFDDKGGFLGVFNLFWIKLVCV